jgi:hypothetical protein
MVSVTEFTLYFTKKTHSKFQFKVTQAQFKVTQFQFKVTQFQFKVTQFHICSFEKYEIEIIKCFKRAPNFPCGSDGAIRRKWRENTAGR